MAPQIDPTQFRAGNLQDKEMFMLIAAIEEAFKVPGYFVEIGIHQANTSKCIVDVLQKLGTRNYLAVDVSVKAERYFYKVFGRDNPIVTMIRGISYQEAKEFRKPCAFVFIDGCHCFDCCAKDIDAWGIKITPGGLLLLHDCDARVQQRTMDTQGECHQPARSVGVYDEMMASKLLQTQFSLSYFQEGMIDRKNEYWGGLAIWRRRTANGKDVKETAHVETQAEERCNYEALYI